MICLWVLIFSVHFTNTGSAQCTGNVLFFENFGGTIVPPFTGSPLPPGTTTYRFDSLGTLFDGEYGIRRTTADIATGMAQFGSWHVGFDHSGGHMMIVNADFTAGKFYETRVSNLCSGSQLSFSAWVANLIRLGSIDPLDPILRFEISSAVSGNVLANFTTPVIPRFSSFTWTKYGFNFLLPAGETDVILRIFNNQVGGNGNDLCLDDIEFSICGPAMNPNVSGVYANSNDACAGSNVNFNTNVQPGYYQNQTYQWQYSSDKSNWVSITGAQSPALTLTNVQPLQTGFYRMLVAEAANINTNTCRSASPVFELNVFTPQPLSINGKTNWCEKDTLLLSSSIQALQYNWSSNSGTLTGTNQLQLNNITTAQTGIYTLNAITKGGCSSTATKNISIQSNQLVRSLPNDTILCNRQSIIINAAIPPAVTFLWNDGSQSSQRSFNTAGIYSLLSSDGVCKRSDTFEISTLNTPIVTLRADTVICFSDSIIVNGVTPGAETYLWSNGSSNPVITVTNTGNYVLTATNFCGSTSSGVFIESEECSDEVFVPNAFTPNNDGLNDLLTARAYFKLQEFELSIYNRWGQRIFSTKKINEGWDGLQNNQKAAPGIYTWLVKYKRNDKQFTRKGTTLLIR